MEQPGLWGLLREDFARHGRVWSSPGFQALAFYRIGVWAGRRPRLVGFVPAVVYKLGSTFTRVVYGIELYRSARVGRRLCIAHQSGIVIHHKARIGDDCLIRQNVTIGQTMTQGRAPTLGDRVEIGAGAVICGSVTIGNDVRIGPNCVVMTDVPDGATVFVPPAKIMQMRKSASPPAPAVTPGPGETPAPATEPALKTQP
jgi:serine O-acetyltransferase